MTQSDFDACTAKLLARCRAIQEAKRAEYIGGSKDVLLNFKEEAAYIGTTPNIVWATFFLKHVKSVVVLLARAFAGGIVKSAEPPQDRWADCINYLLLSWALFVEVSERQDKGLTVLPTPTSDDSFKVEVLPADRHLSV